MSKFERKKWLIKYNPSDDEAIENISLKLGCTSTLATLIYNRGHHTPDDAFAFVSKSQEVLYDPFLLNDMDKAVDRVLNAVSRKEHITIYGDYDVDGVTSVSILYLYLKSIGANVDYYIPSRHSEGYGVSKEAIQRLNSNGTDLIITVDTGVTAIDEVEFAKEIGVDVLITDHHECLDVLPCAVAVINPKRKDTMYPFSSLAGVGVVFKLLCAIEAIRANLDFVSATRKIAYDYADLTAIGTIADVMPVVDENRIIISIGLSQAEKTRKIGLSSLIDICRNGDGKQTKYKKEKKLTSGFVGFTLAPRINAAGRIASADTSVELFLSSDSQKAHALALELCDINKERQLQENRIADMAYEIIENKGYVGKSIMVLDDPNWHHGVIGIVSSRVSDRYGVPSILISFDGNDDPNSPDAIGKGSGRSIRGMNLVEALNDSADLLEKFGGHELAAGLSIKRKNLQAFKERIEAYARNCFNGQEPEHILDIDCEIDVEQLTVDFANELSVLEPYGVANPSPIFVTRNLQIIDVLPVGMNRHLKLTLLKDKKYLNVMMFSTTLQDFAFSIGDEIDIAYNIEVNSFNGVSNLQISLKDIKISERIIDFETGNEEIYQSIKNGESDLSPDYIIPTREDFGVVYQFLQNSARLGKSVYRISRLLFDLSEKKATTLNYVKLKTIIKVFRELNIITIDEIDDYTFAFRFSYTKSKTNLDKSNILRKLKQTYIKK